MQHQFQPASGEALAAEAAAWPGYALRRHNDAAHPLYKLTTLVDFGLRAGDLADVEITEADAYDLSGYLCEEPV